MHLTTGPDLEREKFGELCTRLGVPWRPLSTRNRKLPWDGETLHGMFMFNSMLEPKPMLMPDLWHDLGHWLCCEPRFKKFSGFGQGPAPDLEGSPADGPYASNAGELEASALGIILQWPINPKGAVDHAKLHAWSFHNEWGLWNLLQGSAVLDSQGFQRAARYFLKHGITALGESSGHHRIELGG